MVENSVDKMVVDWDAWWVDSRVASMEASLVVDSVERLVDETAVD